jgi:hypothetical protein
VSLEAAGKRRSTAWVEDVSDFSMNIGSSSKRRSTRHQEALAQEQQQEQQQQQQQRPKEETEVFVPHMPDDMYVGTGTPPLGRPS